MPYLYDSLFVLTCLILVITSYTDVKRRTINSFIFIPVVALGAIFQAFNAAPEYYLIIGILIFLATYLETDLVIYPVIGIIFLVVSVYFVFTSGYYYGFTLMIMSLMFLIGFQEKLFGIGDIKAIVALFFAFTQFPFLTMFTESQTHLVRFIPLSLSMLFNIAIVSMFFIPYVVSLNRKRGSGLGLQSLAAVRYDEKTYHQNEAKFNVRDTPSGKIMVYRTPFMVSVAIGFIITMIFGMWFVFL